MKRALTVAFRELRSYLQDKGDLAFSLLLPIAIFAVMYGAFGGQTQFNGTAHIVNEDTGISATQTGTSNTNYSADLLERLDKISGLEVNLLSRTEADRQLDNSNILLVIYIPADFSSRLASGQTVQLTIKQRGNAGTEGQIVASMVSGAVEQINREFQVQQRVVTLVVDKGIPENQIRITVQKFLEKEQSSPLVGVTETTVGSSPDPVNQFLPGILAMFVLFAISLGAQAIVEERRKGTLERLLTTRLTRSELFAGKFMSGLFRGFVQTLILLVLAEIVFQLFTPVTFLEVLVVAFVFAAAASALGLVITAISRTSDQAVWISVVFTNVSVILGGTWFTIPESGAYFILSKISVSTYVNNALKGLISEGKSLSTVSTEIYVLLGVTVAALIISRLLFRPVTGGGR
jgi:ABC-2 type transport system permease protein